MEREKVCQTCRGQDLRVDKQNVGHCEEGDDAGPDLGGDGGPALRDLEIAAAQNKTVYTERIGTV